MPDKTWKAFERRMSKDVGTTRIPVTGERAGADAKNSMFCFQFKLRRALPIWLWEWLGGVQQVAKRDGKIGVLVVKLPRMRDEDAIVIIRWRDWVDVHGKPSEERSAT